MAIELSISLYIMLSNGTHILGERKESDHMPQCGPAFASFRKFTAIEDSSAEYKFLAVALLWNAEYFHRLILVSGMSGIPVVSPH